jgi:spore coat protein CotH
VSPVSILAPDVVHEVSIAMPQETFERLHTAYASNGEKAWARAEVTLDGTTYADAGVRLKGHSTLDRVGAGQPASAYPWLIRLDKYVDGQRHGGGAELAIRTNNSASHLNEAVALDLLARAGLAGQAGAYAGVRIGPAGTGEQPVLRMLVENPGDAWAERVLGGGGLLYKAEAGGDYSYRGSDPAAYDGVFDQEAGGEDLEPLIAFLDLVNNASESDLATRLPEQLDVAAFATYRAFEALVDNYDAIDGPGNNSYLWWHPRRATGAVVDLVCRGHRHRAGPAHDAGARRPVPVVEPAHLTGGRPRPGRVRLRGRGPDRGLLLSGPSRRAPRSRRTRGSARWCRRPPHSRG